MPRNRYNNDVEDDNNTTGGGGGVEQMEVEPVQPPNTTDPNAAAPTSDKAAADSSVTMMETGEGGLSTGSPGGVGEEDGDEGSARSEATFRFTVENISRLRDQVLSSPTMVRNLPWRIMVMPRQDQSQPSNNTNNGDRGGGGGGANAAAALRNMSLGFFLQCNGDSDSSSWNCSAVATLKILPQKLIPTAEPFSRKISHIFHSKENDWGYSNFVDWAALTDASKGFIKNDSILLEVDVKADAPHGVAWDSKKLTGFVGLKNQGATCYMNSLLQTLFFTNLLRKAVYKMPTESDDSTKSVALALQRVFYELQTCDKPVGTKKLTRSFGWETLDSFMQHDVQEFLRVLLDKLESKMKLTCVEGTVPKLFEGKMISFIKCRHVTYESSRSETYYDIQLNIKGKKDIYESFRDYVATEVLDGDNKYDAGNHGLQEAEKGVIFTSFPPVLHLHLMRFQYDPVTDCSVKSNDRFEFFEKINLIEFLKRDEDGDDNVHQHNIGGSSPGAATAESSYTLHAVLVHSGDNHGGHYVVFINPKGDGRWCKFDDDVVSRCSKTEAIQHNFGGQEMDDLHPGVKQSTNAYMLVYIRDADLSRVLQEVTEDDIPRELLERLKEEKNLEVLKRKERAEAHLFMNVTLMVEDAFAGHMGVDLYDSDKSTPAVQANSRIFKVPKRIKPKEFVDNVADAFNVGASRLRLWPFSFRTNKSIRPIYLDTSPETAKSFEESQYGVTLPIFLEMLPASSEEERLPPFDKENDVILFLKMYDPLNDTSSGGMSSGSGSGGGSLHYKGHICAPITATFNDIARECRRRSSWGEDVGVTLYEEVGAASVEKVVDMGATLDQGLEELMDGDIIVYHKSSDLISSNRHHPQQGQQVKVKSLQEFYTHMQYRHEVTFVDKQTPSESFFTCELSLKCSYGEMAELVGTRLAVHPKFIQFFKSQPYKDIPGYPIKYEPETELMSVLNVINKPMRSPFKLFYYVLGIPVTELEHKKQFKVAFYTPEDQERELIIYVNKSPRILVRDVLGELLRVVNAERKSSPPSSSPLPLLQRLRMVEISQHRVVSLVDEDTGADIIVQNNTVNRYYRAEEFPPEDLHVDDKAGEALVGVAHFHKEARSTFGVPFIIKVTPGEKWSSLRSRLAVKSQMSEKEWSKIRIALVTSATAKFVVDDTLPPAAAAEDPQQQQYNSSAATSPQTISLSSCVLREQFLPPSSSSYPSSVVGGVAPAGGGAQLLPSRPWLGIEHVNKAPKRSRYSTLEKAIKIYN